jgi:hypothetical protein
MKTACHRLGLLVLPLAVLLAVVAGRSVARSPGPPSPDAEREVFRDLAMLVIGEVDAKLLPADGTTPAAEDYEGYIDRLLADPRFANDVAPSVALHRTLPAPPFFTRYVLQSWPGPGGQPIYFLHAPCEAKEALSVAPWWQLDEPVLVCPGSYQPTHIETADTGWFCGGYHLLADRSTFCGCGKNLVNCVKDDEQLEALNASFVGEVTRTIAHLVANDAPLAAIFTANESVRDANVEAFYNSGLLLGGALSELPSQRHWPGGRPMPRRELWPGQHAGILTSPAMTFQDDAPRAVLKHYYDVLWCKPFDSSNVTAEQILALGAADLRYGEGWQRLAAMPVCTNCHARLDYGVQFFLGFPGPQIAMHYVRGPKERGRGKLYGDDIDDLRGEARRSPRGFAHLAVTQPEFAACMVRNVLEHVFGQRASPDDRQALLAAFRQTGTLRALMRVALQRFASQQIGMAPSPAIARHAEAGTTSEGVGVRLPPAARHVVEAQCLDCHDHGPLSLRPPEIERPLAIAMLGQVAFGGMPKSAAGMALTERRSLVRDLVSALWPEPTASRQALEHFAGRATGPPVHLPAALFKRIHAETGSTPQGRWALVESSVHGRLRYNPGLASASALEALDACRAVVGASEREACVAEALAVDKAVIGLVD